MPRSSHKMWAVISPPELPEYVWGGDQRYVVGHFPDYVQVEAPTKREALRLGVKAMKEWPTIARGDGRNPFAGVEVELLLCGHGTCHCETCVNVLPEGICQQCWDESEDSDAEE